MLTQIYNGHVLTSKGWLNGASVIFNKGRIIEISTDGELISEAKKIDAHGMHVVPGGIDMHVHGGGGSDFMEGTPEAFNTAVTAHLKHGTTAILPTLSSSTLPMIETAATTCAQLMEDPKSPILGLHLEGPYFNPRRAGAQLPDIIRMPDPDEYQYLVGAYKCIKRWDSAPELPGALKLGRFLSHNGVIAAIAHTEAEYEDIRAAYESGYSHVTHFYNAMPGFHNVREFKHAGTVEAVYLMENMTVEVIADGIHVPPPLLQLVYRAKGLERTALVTDALAVAASDSTQAFDPRVIIEDGVCKLADRSALAGSIATMDRLIRTAVKVAGIPLDDACRMASETPSRILGIYDRKGTLQEGKDADILIFDDDINLKAVFAMGEEVNLAD